MPSHKWTWSLHLDKESHSFLCIADVRYGPTCTGAGKPYMRSKPKTQAMTRVAITNEDKRLVGILLSKEIDKM
jgi:hypothetical protein